MRINKKKCEGTGSFVLEQTAGKGREAQIQGKERREDACFGDSLIIIIIIIIITTTTTTTIRAGGAAAVEIQVGGALE